MRVYIARPRCLTIIAYVISFIILSLVLTYLLDQGNLTNIDSLRSNQDISNDSDNHSHIDPLRLHRKQVVCRDINLAVVSGAFNATRSFYVLLKSILFYRTDVIHIHLFVDNISERILRQLFRTWTIPDLHINFYNLSEYEHRISWIPNSHYSKNYGLMKLILLDVLSTNQTSVSKVIVLDTDTLVLGNILTLWNEFEFFKNGTAIGLVENQSDWYLRPDQAITNHRVWPAPGKGYNSGVILADLVALKLNNWPQLWREVANAELTTKLSTTLADQDIFNAIAKSEPNLIHRLPCEYNMQLNDHVLLEKICSEQSNDLQILHWNSPNKLMTRNPDADYYANWYRTFRNWDGNLLRRSACGKTRVSGKPIIVTDPHRVNAACMDIRPNEQDQLRTLLYIKEFQVDKRNSIDVTICVHLSIDRLQTLDELARHWIGPISVAIYLPEAETSLLLEFIEMSDNLNSRLNIGYHLVFRDIGHSYPINRMRNIAIQNAITDFVYITDIDFMPSYNLCSYLSQAIKSLQEGMRSESLDRVALVVPVFENSHYKFEYPNNKNELITMLNLGKVSTFREEIWPAGQSATDYRKWQSATHLYEVSWQPDYEPFVVMNRSSRSAPLFDERFLGFGWNKVEHAMQLAAEGYQFFVLPDGFAVHKFHSASFDITQHRQSAKYRSCIKLLKRTFLLEIKQKYPDFFGSISFTTLSSSRTGTETNGSKPSTESLIS